MDVQYFRQGMKLYKKRTKENKNPQAPEDKYFTKQWQQNSSSTGPRT